MACSALVNSQVEKNAFESGFDITVQAPLTIEIMQKKILLNVFELAN